MHRLHWGRIPVNFDQLFTPESQAHSHATRAATRGGYIWQMASTVKAKRSLKHRQLMAPGWFRRFSEKNA